MRLLLQRVSQASVTVDGNIVGAIGKGYLLFLCVMKGDGESEADQLVQKVAGLRLFDGSEGKINDQSLLDIGGEALVISQFTLAGDTRKGRRPDYTAAAGPEEAKNVYNYFVQRLHQSGVKKVEAGVFGSYMSASLINDGPVTIMFDTASL